MNKWFDNNSLNNEPVFVFLAILLFAFLSSQKAVSETRILADNVRIRTSPNTASKVIHILHWGDSVGVLEHKGDWARVLYDGDYIDCEYFEFLDEEPVKECTSPDKFIQDVIEGWIYAAYFDPCPDGFNSNEVDPAILKYPECKMPDKEELMSFMNYFSHFSSGYDKQDLKELRQLVNDPIYVEDDSLWGGFSIDVSFEAINKDHQNFSFFRYQWLRNQGGSADKCIDGLYRMIDGDDTYDPYGLCYLDYGQDWISVSHGTTAGGETLFFVKTPKSWKLIRIETGYN